ncbi:MAG: DUF7059 domain-containing protein [Ancrocorticia sp.]|uniref:DUF7059 domain-containing protein n=1 Tax=Ancrocorticia sp. TaxID=2593684 RepID=UPI003F926947
MTSRISESAPTLLLNEALIARLRSDLGAAEWTEGAIEELLSPMALGALRRDQLTPAAMELERNNSPAAVLTRLFVLAEAADAAAVEQAFPRLGVKGARELGLLETALDSEALRGTVELRPHESQISPHRGDSRDLGELAESGGQAAPHWWVASDLSQAQTGRAPREDYVLGIASASSSLARLTLREPVDAALDLGCGCGILALYLTLHSQRVIATDISERACNFTRFNSLLNEAAIDVRQGSFFEPVAGEQFDLITSNPPFVITPQAVRGGGTLEYRDGGMERDSLIPWIIGEAVEHVAPGGTLQMLANWEVNGAESEWAVRPRQWIERAASRVLARSQSVDAWLVQRDLLDVSQYAEWWIRDAKGSQITPTQWQAEYREWLRDFSAAGTTYIGLGSLALRVGPAGGMAQADGRLNLVCEYLPEGKPVDALAVQTALASLTIPAQWESMPLVCAPDVREVRYFVPGRENPELIRVTQGRAGGRERSVTSAVAALIGVSDGELSPAQVIPAIATLLTQDEADVRGEIEAALPELLRSGVLQFLEDCPSSSSK